MAALSWFMDHHTSFNPTLKDLCLKLAHFVLTNNFVECKELGGAMYQQVVGTAMGTSFSVVYTVTTFVTQLLEVAHNRHFYEIIRAGRPCKAYFDLEAAPGVWDKETGWERCKAVMRA